MDKNIARRMTKQFGSKFLPREMVTDFITTVREGRKEIGERFPEGERTSALMQVQNEVALVARRCKPVLSKKLFLRLDHEVEEIREQLKRPSCAYDHNGESHL